MHHPSSLSSPKAHSLLDLIQTNNDEVTEPTDGGDRGLKCQECDRTCRRRKRRSVIDVTEPAEGG